MIDRPVRRLGRDELVRRAAWHSAESPHWEPILDREWLVTNGLGGYASGTVAGAGTRRYHGYLIASLPAPLGRLLTLARMGETLRLADGSEVRLEGEERAGSVRFDGTEHLVEFRLECGLPVWRYQVGDTVLEKRVFMPYERNAVLLMYHRIAGNAPIRLDLRPYVHFRGHEEAVDTPLPRPFTLTVREECFKIAPSDPRLPPLELQLRGEDPEFVLRQAVVKELLYRIEAHRGYTPRGDLWTPGEFSVSLPTGATVALVAGVSGDGSEATTDLDPEAAHQRELERRDALLGLLGVGVRGCRSVYVERPPDPPPTREREATRTDREKPSPGGAVRGDGRGVEEPLELALAELALSADQFLVSPGWRSGEGWGARSEESRSVVAGYHWFSDWGRDTMIALEGLTLVTGRHEEARRILRDFARHVRDGLIPNLFPEREDEGVYHTADATLWMFHALERYQAYTDDRQTVHVLLPVLQEVIARHLEGTRFGIGVDPADGLLRQGAAGFQLTWMDAKVDDWVVTPRRGKAVEINALWYNALRLLEGWLKAEGREDEATELRRHAERAHASFQERFWYPEGTHLYDVVDGESGDDPACRPNQLLALSLRHPILARERWEAVLEAVRKRLLTPYGLRTLAPDHPDYRAEYFGDLRARDAAYHQGTVWPWLMGPFLDGWRRVHPEEEGRARDFLAPLLAHLDEAGLGTISEIFDAEPPHTPRGCIAQAWSVAETLRCLARSSPRRTGQRTLDAGRAGFGCRS